MNLFSIIRGWRRFVGKSGSVLPVAQEVPGRTLEGSRQVVRRSAPALFILEKFRVGNESGKERAKGGREGPFLYWFLLYRQSPLSLMDGKSLIKVGNLFGVHHWRGAASNRIFRSECSGLCRPTQTKS